MTIITHYNLDLDAASSAALALIVNAEKNPKLRFISTSVTWDEIKDEITEEDLVLDIDASGKGLKGKISAFSSYIALLETKWALYFMDLADIIDATDSGLTSKAPDLNDFFLNIKYALNSDEEVVSYWKVFLEGIIKRQDELKRAYDQLERVKWYDSIAVMPRDAERPLSKLLKQNGASFVIYEEDGAQGIIISNKVPNDLRQRLALALPGWFFHEKSFIIAWGTKKGFKKENSGYTAMDLVNLIKDLS